MEAKELQIGNYVYYSNVNKYITRVEDIRRYGDENSGYTYAIKGKRDKRDPLYEKYPEDSFNVDILYPIPITDDMLENNGFTDNYCEDDLSYAMSCGDDIGIHINGKGGCMDEMYFTYFHELQNAMKLCKIEKEIKP